MKNFKTKFAMLYCLWCIMYSGNVLAQNATFTFYDVQTGFSIVPEDVTLYNAESRAFKNSFTKKDLSRGKAIEMDLKTGDYNLAISALGYKEMDINFTATKDMRVNRKVMLSPKNVPTEVSVSYLRSLHRSDRTIITGYVADDKGMPVADALIQSDDGAKAHTNQKGYFQLSLSYDKEDFHDVQLKAFNVTKKGFKTERKEKVVVTPNGDAIYRIQLERGKGKNTHAMSDFIIENDEIIGRPERQMPKFDESFFSEPDSKSGQLKSANECLPQTISVGYLDESSGSSYCCPALGIACTNVVTLTLEEYTKRVIDNEWLHGWSNLNNIDEAYKAAATAIRTFGAFRVNNPIANTYHVTDSPCDQVYDNSSTSWSISAGDATSGMVLKVNGNFRKAEYSSENNNLGGTSCVSAQSGAGCGNGFCKDAISGACINDPLGINKIQYGHGRNMSQFGSARWATGLAIGFWCNDPYSGLSHGQGTRTWQQIINMYYPSHELINCNNTLADECEILNNDSFDTNTNNWSTYKCMASSVGGVANITNIQLGANFWDVIFRQQNITLQQGKTYTLSIRAKASSNRPVVLKVMNPNPYQSYSEHTINLTTSMETFTSSFTMNAAGTSNAFVELLLGHSASGVQIDFISLEENNCTAEPPCEVLNNHSFDTNTNNWSAYKCMASSAGGVANITNIQLGANFWDVIFRQQNITLQQGKTYTLSMRAKASSNRPVVLKVMNPNPYQSYSEHIINLTTSMETFTSSFTMNAVGTSNAFVELLLGHSASGVQIDFISLDENNCTQNYNLVSNGSGHSSINIDNAKPTTPYSNRQDTKLEPNIRLYPNPTTHTIHVEYELPQSTLANIAVFDTFGKLVKNLTEVELSAGIQTLNMDVSDLPAGMYLYTLQTDEWKATKKFIITK